MRLALLLIASVAWGALGDNAPAIPSTYITSHPRLPYPTQAWLESLHDNLPTRYSDAADDYLQNTQVHINLRYAMLAYLAAKASGENMASEPYATWKTSILSAADKFGLIVSTIELSDDSVTGDGSGGITTTANIQTGCGGGSCNGRIVSAYGRWYVLTVTGASTGTLATLGARYSGVGYPNGATKIRVAGAATTGAPNPDYVAYAQAMIYDWMYSDMTPTQRTDIALSLDGMCTMIGGDYLSELSASGGYSPYNDLFYGPGGNSQFGLAYSVAAISIYPDLGATALVHLNRSNDIIHNIVLPAWKHLGGAATEGWSEYWNLGQKHWILGATLPWAHASGRGTAFYTTDHPYIKESALWWIYVLQPNLMFAKLGDTTGWPNEEYTLCGGSAGYGMFTGIAAIYNDSAIRKFARQFNNECGITNAAVDGTPDGYEPSAWPYYEPDTTAKSVAERSTLAKCKNFDGVGVIICRTGWSEDDTWTLIKYGDAFWTGKVHSDVGHFSIYSRGSLAIDSGSYAAGASGWHRVMYSSQAIAHNTMTFTDSADVYPSQRLLTWQYGDSDYTCFAMPNDGGQRRVSAVQTYFGNEGCTGGGTQVANIVSVFNRAHWMRNREWWKMSNLLAYVTDTDYTYIAVDLTKAYQRDSASTGSVHDRTRRLQKFVRHFLWIPQGTAAYELVYDQAITLDEDFSKRWLLHSINEPSIASNAFTILRTDNAAVKPFATPWPFGWMENLSAYDNNSCGWGFCYQYNGKLQGWSFVNGSARTPTKVGGAGSEFDDGTGTNRKECMNDTYCGSGSYDAGLGSTLGEMHPEADASPFEPGSWRLELTPASAAKPDHFLVLMRATNDGDSTAVSSVTPTTTSTHYGVTWSDDYSGGCSYAVTFEKNGVGGTVTRSGAGCTTIN